MVYSIICKDRSETNPAYSTPWKDRSEAISVYSTNSKDRSEANSAYSRHRQDQSQKNALDQSSSWFFMLWSRGIDSKEPFLLANVA